MEHLGLIPGLDTLGNDVDVQRQCHLGDGLNDCSGCLVVGQQADERPVDLQRRRPKLGQVTERGVAGAEVVDRHPYAHVLECLDRLLGSVGVIEERMLGHLDAEKLRRQSGRGDEITYLLDELGKVPRGLVGRHIEFVGQGVLDRPTGHLFTRLLEGDGVEAALQTGFLCDTEELRRSEQPAFGMGPTDERLEAGRGIGRAVDDRLEVDRDLFVVDRGAQLTLERLPLDRHVVRALTEDLDAVAAALLGPIHRGVGVTQQLVGGHLAGLTHGDADAERRMDRRAVVGERCGE